MHQELSPQAAEALQAIERGFTEMKAKNTELETRLQKEEEERKGLESRMNKRGLPTGSPADGETKDAPIMLTMADGNRVPLLSKKQRHSAFDSLQNESPFGTPGMALKAMITGGANSHEKKWLAENNGPNGGYIMDPSLTVNLIDNLRARSTAMEAGAYSFNMDTPEALVIKVTGDPSAEWLGEGEASSGSGPTFGTFRMVPRTCRVMIKTSRELVEDAVNAAGLLENLAAESMAAALDEATLFGTGTNSQPLGLYNESGYSTVDMGTNGAAITNYSPILNAIEDVETANHQGVTAAIMHPRTKRAFAGLVDTTGQPLQKPADVAKVPFLSTTRVPINQTHGSANNASCILTGDFRWLWVGVRKSMGFFFSRELYAATGQYALFGWMRADVAVIHPSAFSVVKGIIPAS